MKPSKDCLDPTLIIITNKNIWSKILIILFDWNISLLLKIINESNEMLPIIWYLKNSIMPIYHRKKRLKDTVAEMKANMIYDLGFR